MIKLTNFLTPIFFAFALCFLCNDLFPQKYSPKNKRKVDSLRQELSIAKPDTNKIDVLLNLTFRCYLQETDSALKYAHEALELCKTLNREKELAETYGWLGYLYNYKNNNVKAIEYLHEGLKLAKKLNNKHEIAAITCNIGMSHDYQNENELAKEYYQKALAMFTEMRDKKNMAINMGNIAFIEKRLGNTDKAYELNLKALKLHKEVNDEPNYALSLNNLAGLEKADGKYDDALKKYFECAEIYSKMNHRKGLALAYANISSIYLLTSKLKEAEEYADKAYNLANEIGVPESIKNATKFLTEIYERTGRYEQSLDMYKLHIEMRDSINNAKTLAATVKQQAKYEYEKQKAIDDSEHEKQLAIEQEAKEKQQILTVATGAGLGLVGIFLIFVFNRLKVTRKQKGIIELAHSQLEEKNTEILDSISYAKRIQSAILPPGKVVKEYLQESFIFYKPKDIVAGDFYWLETISDEGRMMSNENSTPNTQHSTTILFAAADCTGHGVPGAMVSVVCNNGLNRAVREHGLTDPGKILDKTREIVVAEFEKSEEEVKDGMDIALCSLSVDSNQSTVLKYAGAHNPLWIIRKDTDLIEEIKANKQPIGKFDHPEPYTTHTLKLLKGDTIYIFSDGYADQFGGEKGKKLKTTNFKKLLLSIQQENMQKQKELVNEAFENWKGKLEQLDDVCVIGVRV